MLIILTPLFLARVKAISLVPNNPSVNQVR